MMRNQMFTRVAVSTLALACLPVMALAQQAANAPPAQPAPDNKPVATLKVQAREVLLPVTVRDKHGALVTTLDKADFTLTEDGRPQVIKSFTHETNLPYKLGLLIDTSRSVSGALENERKAGGEFVDAMLPAQPHPKDPDEAFLIHFDHQVELLEDFTTSRDKLHHELDDMSASRQSSRDDSQGPETTGDDRERPSHTRGGTQLYDAIFLASDDLMKHKDGRKALVVFSDGVDRGSKDTMNDAIDAADRANVEVFTIYFKGEEERSSNFGFPGGGHHGGMGYPGGGGGYPGGGGGYPGGGGQRRGGEKPAVDGKKIMAQIAERTGGHAYEAKKKDDLGPIYNQIAEELRSQYLLTYTPDKVDNDGGYHKVALKASKGDLNVTTREGYFAPGGEDSK
ncbi:MAG: VWA domain-containing protein [Terracidiphilus sp.]